MLKPFEHQLDLGRKSYEVLKQYGLAYLSGEERTGKTIASIVCAELCDITSVLIVTKKKAYTDWNLVLQGLDKNHIYSLTTYHQINKVASNFDMVIIDEAHNYISSYPRTGAIWNDVHKKVYGKPILYLSATPHPQGYQQLFHQFALSAWSPWKQYKNFYKWFKDYGEAYTIDIQGIPRTQYDRAKTEDIIADTEHLFVTVTREELGFEHEPEDRVHYIQLDEATRDVYNELVEHEMVELRIGTVVCDTKSKMRAVLHQLEGGTIKTDTESHTLRNSEKIDFILDTFGDDPSLVIMYNFKQELIKLKDVFKKATILQATSYAEGVALHMYDHLVIYSQDYSTARHSQRRARQCNINRDKPIIVHHLIVRKAISAQVYKTVNVNKKNYVDSLYERNKI